MDTSWAGRKGECQLITYVTDRAIRPGYAIDAGKSNGVSDGNRASPRSGLERTVEWYLANTEWLDHVTSSAYRSTLL
ncbi:MAG: hypothetical protein IPO05_02880 [Flavobacteriales bacterium]|nr:hypothetical protein [Flavobacteriales bacterium]